MNYEDILMYQDMIDAAFESDDTLIGEEGYSKAHKERVWNAQLEKRAQIHEKVSSQIEATRKIGGDTLAILHLLRAVHKKKGIVTARKTLLALFEWARSNEGQNGQPDEIYDCVKRIRKMFAAGITEGQIGREINVHARLTRGQSGSWYTTSASQRDKYMNDVRNYKI